MSLDCDVLVIGGGPAGSTVASLLAKKGRQVILLEKDYHPRFHIGESLLPHTLPILKELGVLEKIADIGIVKYGAEFVANEYAHSSFLRFRKALNREHPYAFQVKRAEFDQILFEHSQSLGVQAYQGVTVTSLDFSDNTKVQVQSQDEQGQTEIWTTRFVVDATGRDTFTAHKNQSKVKNKQHNSAAIFTHVKNAQQLTGEHKGDITIFWLPHGWGWLIPFRDGTMSVGTVCWPHYLKQRQGDLDSFFWDTLKLNPKVYDRLAGAQAIAPVQATGNFSYYNLKLSGERWLAVGDACAFIDPVFSSGVHLAMSSSKLAATAIDAYLEKPVKSILKGYEKQVKTALKTFSWLIYRFTQPSMRFLFMHPKNVFRVEEALLSLLAGDVYGDTKLKRPFFLFKLIYYFHVITHWQANRQAKNMRQRDTHD